MPHISRGLLQTLSSRVLYTGRSELETALRKFPFQADTEAQLRRRTALEQALTDTDRSVRTFEKPRVYVSPN
jgi:hypothetical protein